MTINIDLVLYILAAISLGLDSFSVNAGRVKLFSLAAFFLVLSFII